MTPEPPYDVARVRSHYPALADGWAYLDGAAGTQVPRSVIDAVAGAWALGIGNYGGAFPASDRSTAHTAGARQAVADLGGAPDPDGVLLGPNMTSMTYRVAAALAMTWREGDEVVLTRLDHDANVRPWMQAAGRVDAVVRFVDPVLPSLDLPAERYDGVLSERTRLVALTAASNVVGTRPPVREITDAAHAVGALTFVDGVARDAARPGGRGRVGGGPLRDQRLQVVRPAPRRGRGGPGPARHPAPGPARVLSGGGAVALRDRDAPFAQHAGLVAAVHHLADLLPDQVGTRRERLLASMAAVERYEHDLFTVLLGGLDALPRVHPVGDPTRRTATAYFTVDGHTPQEVARHCAAQQVNVWAGHMYAWELTGLLGIRDSGSAVRAGLVHYNDRSDVDALLAALASL